MSDQQLTIIRRIPNRSIRRHIARLAGISQALVALPGDYRTNVKES